MRRLIVAVWVAGVSVTSSALSEAGQDPPRVYSNRDVAPPPCRCVSATTDGWGPGSGLSWLQPRLAVPLDRGAWLGFDLPQGMLSTATGWSTAGIPSDSTAAGGFSVRLTPADAELWVDGALAGRAEDFHPGRPGLPLPPGIHRVEFRAPGFAPLLFDILTTPGHVLPYQGELRRLP